MYTRVYASLYHTWIQTRTFIVCLCAYILYTYVCVNCVYQLILMTINLPSPQAINNVARGTTA